MSGGGKKKKKKIGCFNLVYLFQFTSKKNRLLFQSPAYRYLINRKLQHQWCKFYRSFKNGGSEVRLKDVEIVRLCQHKFSGGWKEAALPRCWKNGPTEFRMQVIKPFSKFHHLQSGGNLLWFGTSWWECFCRNTIENCNLVMICNMFNNAGFV